MNRNCFRPINFLFKKLKLCKQETENQKEILVSENPSLLQRGS
jgi:hypothetical protein